MITLVADVNIQGHVQRLVSRMQSPPWRDFWDYLDLRCMDFNDLGLASDATDLAVWNCCQENQAFLLTNNRNDDGPESLESALRNFNVPQALPVFTISHADKILENPEYSDQVIDRLLRYLLEMENIRGTGRLFLP